MKITLKNTSTIVQLNGIPARVWEGETEGGVPIVAFVTRISVQDDADSSELDRELRAEPPPQADPIWPMRMIL